MKVSLIKPLPVKHNCTRPPHFPPHCGRPA